MITGIVIGIILGIVGMNMFGARVEHEFAIIKADIEEEIAKVKPDFEKIKALIAKL